MDIFIAHQMAKNINNIPPLDVKIPEIKKIVEKKDAKNMIKIKNTCSYCGQNYYWCVCDCT